MIVALNRFDIVVSITIAICHGMKGIFVGAVVVKFGSRFRKGLLCMGGSIGILIRV